MPAASQKGSCSNVTMSKATTPRNATRTNGVDSICTSRRGSVARDFLRPDWCPSLDADAGDGDIGAHSEAMSPRPSRCFDEAGLDIKFVEARVD